MPRTVHRTLFALWGVFWLLMIVISVEDHRDPAIRWWEPLLWEGSSCLLATAGLLLERRMAPRWRELLPEPRRWFARHLVWMPLVAAVFIGGVYALRHGVYALVGVTYRHAGWAYVVFYESSKIVLFSSLWVGVVFGLESFARWQHERERLLELERHLAETELAQLRAQLQPHFLFNALNTISSLMQVDMERADALLAQLADLLRASLQSGARQTTSLREEIELARRYAHIMQARFAERVSVAWDVAADAGDAEVPAMLLQPLLENAFKHGVEPSLTPVAIRISARRGDEQLRVTVHNSNGRFSPSRRAGIGLRNCRERLALLYGDAARLEVQQESDGVSATLVQPWRSVTS
ncbi:MAG TPA: histidine kinase [Polyangiaceae bacterium]|nr:histidine kinase [Polyangiaceae bacterium]